MAPMRTGSGVALAAGAGSPQAAATASSGTTSAAETAARANVEVLPRVLRRFMGRDPW